ncbi:Actin-like ATPase [Apiospora hydei]|uniref:glycerol kinase n=1 Tax=Apiospora hydei TaxID=1337664 RepID=A0ABR1WN72_9PEZI
MPGLITEDGASGAHDAPYTNDYTNGADTNGHPSDQLNARINGYANGHSNGASNGSTREVNHDDWFIGSVDQGTTSSRFIIFNSWADPVAMHQIEFENLYPQSGWHDQAPYELLDTVEECIEKATEKFVALGYLKSQIKAVGITNQRETTICWDKNTGEPLCQAVVWPDTRTKDLVRELKNRPGAEKLTELCGLPLSTYPSSVKLMWMIKHHGEVSKAYEESRLAFGTVDSWLIYKLNGGIEKNIHVTDTTNASRTMFMNLHTRQYDDQLLNFFEIDPSKVALPKIIGGCLGDQSSALVGQCGFNAGQAKNTYGTGCFLLYNVGTKPVISKYGLLATVAYDFGEGSEAVYALEGSVAVAGSGVKFLLNNLGFERDSHRISALAESVEDNGGLVFVTAFSGLFAPYWIDDAKGTIFGITQHTKRGHIARATLEATCFQTRAILDAMERDSGHKLHSLSVDGGMSNSDLTMQTQADVSDIHVARPPMRETTALGAAIAAGMAADGCGWHSLEDVAEMMRIKDHVKIFKPVNDKKKVARMYANWERAVQMSRGWVVQEEDDGPEHATAIKQSQS